MTDRYQADYLAPMDGDFSLYAPGYLDVAGGRVTGVGPADAAPPLEPGGRMHRIAGLLLPGLVNAHAHSAMTVLRGAGEGLPLDRWLSEVIWPREARLTEEDVALGMTAGAAELLLGGVTTSNEMYFFPAAVADGAKAAGLRVVVSAAIIDAPALEKRFGGPEHMIEAALRLRAMHRDDDLVEIALGPHSAYALGDGTLAEIGEVAAAEDMLVHIHVAETRHEGDATTDRTGRSVPAHLADLEVFAARSCAAHCVWVDDDDIRLLAEHRVGVAHCPGSNGKLASGVSPVAAMRRAGIAVGAATDGPASNNDLDVLEEARLAVLYSRLREDSAAALGVRDALEMITADAAAALGRWDIGSLQPGRRADMIRIDLEHLVYEPILAPSDVLAHLVWSGSARDVKDVWVGGRRVVSDGRCLTVDVPKVRDRLRSVARRIAG